MSEIGELSEKYEGEDEIIDVFVPYLHVIIPLKTVEAGVKMYNTIGNAMKTSAETFVRELASAKKTYARVRPNKILPFTHLNRFGVHVQNLHYLESIFIYR